MSEEQQQPESAENAHASASETTGLHQGLSEENSSKLSIDTVEPLNSEPAEQSQTPNSDEPSGTGETKQGSQRERTQGSQRERTQGVRAAKGGRPGDRNKNKRSGKRSEVRQPRAPFRGFTKFAVVLWSGQREPADSMYWAEAHREGDWVVFKTLEQVRTRREIMERLLEMEAGLVGFDFPFSYPKPFLEMLHADKIADGWRQLSKKVREDLKKNSDDGIRLWIERMGKYRESSLESDEEAQMWRDRKNFRRPNDRDPRGRNDRFARDRRPEPIPAHEKRSLAERFRRTDLPLRRSIEPYVAPIMIAYNKLTSRYEFSDTTSRGRAALLGLSMFDQVLDSKPEVSIWPMMRPGKLTFVEVQTALFAGQKPKPAEEIRHAIDLYEDSGWEIPANIRDLAARNPDAQRAFLTVIGMIRTENREDRMNRPMRDYQDLFYDDAQVQQEGWIYGVGYRHPDQPRREDSPSNSNQESDAGDSRRQKKSVHAEATVAYLPEPAMTDNVIVQEPVASETEAIPQQETPVEVHAAHSNGASNEESVSVIDTHTESQ